MKRCLAAMFAAMIVSGPLAAPTAQAAPPATHAFEVVPVPPPPPRPHKAAYLCLLAGAGMFVVSHSYAEKADDAYERYNTATDPGEITAAWDQTVRYDKVSSGTLFAGEALVAAGLYLRFLHRPAKPVALVVRPGACAVSLRF